MPFPLLALVPVLVAWGTRAVATYGLARLFSEEPVQELKNIIFGYVVEYAARYAGLNLNPDDPISDASFSAAVSERVGFPIRTLRDKEMIIEDLDNYAALLVSQRSGYVVRSVKNVEVLKQDLMRIALAVASEKIGIPLGSVDDIELGLDPEAIKAQLLGWAKAQLLAQVKAQVKIEALEMATWGDITALMGYINERVEKGEISAHSIALAIADRMAVAAVAEYQQVVVGMTKRQRRQEQNRQAQVRFRERHGARRYYVPLGMVGGARFPDEVG